MASQITVRAKVSSNIYSIGYRSCILRACLYSWHDAHREGTVPNRSNPDNQMLMLQYLHDFAITLTPTSFLMCLQAKRKSYPDFPCCEINGGGTSSSSARSQAIACRLDSSAPSALRRQHCGPPRRSRSRRYRRGVTRQHPCRAAPSRAPSAPVCVCVCVF